VTLEYYSSVYINYSCVQNILNTVDGFTPYFTTSKNIEFYLTILATQATSKAMTIHEEKRRQN